MSPLILALTLVAASVPAPGGAPSFPHVRVQNERVARILTSALDRSPTLRRLVDTLDRSDVIVYVEVQPQLPRALPAGMIFVGAGAGMRYLRIVLNPVNTELIMLSMLGHELQHAVEVVSAPWVQSRETLAEHFSRIGTRSLNGTGYETEAARRAGRVVTHEFLANGARPGRIARSRGTDIAMPTP
jgi:hypothetical protein